MTTSILYFSRTGDTKATALRVGTELGIKTYRLTDNGSWFGPGGHLRGLWLSAVNRQMALTYDKGALDCDHLILMSPLWLGGPTPAVKTLLQEINHPNITLVMHNNASPINGVLKKYQKKYTGIKRTYGITRRKHNADMVIAKLCEDLVS